MKIRNAAFFCVLLLASIAGAAWAEPVATEKKEGAETSAVDSLTTPAAACDAKSLASSFDYPTCGQCSNDGCRGQYVGTICGLDQFGQLMVCQDQLVGCYPNSYPETIYCRCTSDIVP